MEAKVYQHIARKFDAYIRCLKTGNNFAESHEDSIIAIVNRYLPHGSGIDTGITFDIENSNPNRLIFTFGFHHMDESGYYDGWTEHKLIVTPSLAFSMDMKITGRDRNDIKEYLYQVFEYSLNQTIDA